jgi:hypothetical protein
VTSEPTAGPLTGTTTPAPVRRPAAGSDWVLVALLCVLAGVVAVFGVFFLPTFVGAVPVPAVIVGTTAALLVLPRVAYLLTRRMAAAMAPAVVWFLVTIGLYLTTNGLYVGVPVAWRGGWQFYLLVGLGAIAAAISLGLVWSEQLEQELSARKGRDSGEQR